MSDAIRRQGPQLAGCKLPVAILPQRPPFAAKKRYHPFMNYQSLTQDQQSQVAYLFADEFFPGSDPKAYDYEVNSIGQVVSRTPLTPQKIDRRTHGDKRAEVVMRKDPKITEEQARRTDAASNALAAHLVRRDLDPP